MSQDAIALNLLEATVTLYPADSTGAPVLDAPIFTGAAAENLSLRGRWIKTETRASAAKYPRKHPLVAQYDISIGRIWVLPTDDLTGYQADHQHYVLDVVWTEEDTQQWHRRTYYGVTISEQNLDSRDIESGFLDGQMFEAEYFIPDSGDPTSPPGNISSTLPYQVQYTGTNGHALTLYSYDSATQTFAAVESTTGRATISYVNNLFTVKFAGDTIPALQALNSNDLQYLNGGAYTIPAPYRSGWKGLVVQGGLFAQTPSPKDLPRLDFYFGAERLATVTRTGLYSPQFVETTPASAAGKFELKAESVLVGAIEAGQVKAEAFVVE